MDTEMDRATTYRIIGWGGTALVTSSLSALVVLFLLKWRGKAKAEARHELMVERTPAQPAINTQTSTAIPDHFSENLVVPGFTHTGPEIEQDGARRGRSAEGV